MSQNSMFLSAVACSSLSLGDTVPVHVSAVPATHHVRLLRFVCLRLRRACQGGGLEFLSMRLKLKYIHAHEAAAQEPLTLTHTLTHSGVSVVERLVISTWSRSMLLLTLGGSW